MNNKQEIYYGYMSKKQLEQVKETKESNNEEFRINYYEDINGNEVAISEVSNRPLEEYHNNFDDVVKLGKLKKWLRSEKYK